MCTAKMNTGFTDFVMNFLCGSGGTLITLSGLNMDSAAVPQINITTVVQRFSNSTDPGRITFQNVTSNSEVRGQIEVNANEQSNYS